jgi:hypothetical protein
MPLKYLMTDDGPILFPISWDHAQVASFAKLLSGADTLSAGFVRQYEGEALQSYGRSQGLSIGSDKDDAQEIGRLLAKS